MRDTLSQDEFSKDYMLKLQEDIIIPSGCLKGMMVFLKLNHILVLNGYA